MAALLGLALGLERAWQGHSAGLRTPSLLALSAAMLTVAGLRQVPAIAEAGGEPDP